jgi:threonylcarbamoyladenosine tRNA methylthiotransferase MtaB
LKPEEAASIQGVDLILGANDKFNITKYLENLDKHPLSEMHGCTFKEITDFQPASSFGDRTRSFLKVQDGCNYFCTYCAIPLARGRSRNPSIDTLVQEAKNLAKQGIKEINLTGVNIGDFGKSTGETFLSLLQALDQLEDIERIRMGSVEPNLLDKEIIDYVAESKRIAPHFHLPLQAGTDEVLSLMKRRYNTELFMRRVDLIKQLMPFAFVGVDVITGMNGESDQLFEKAYQFIERLDISQLHVFPFSERANTRALAIAGVVPVAERKNRAQKLIRLSEKKLMQFYQKNLGRTASVLFENDPGKRISHGWTENYIKVEVPYQAELLNTTKSVILRRIGNNGHVAADIL